MSKNTKLTRIISIIAAVSMFISITACSKSDEDESEYISGSEEISQETSASEKKTPGSDETSKQETEKTTPSEDETKSSPETDVSDKSSAPKATPTPSPTPFISRPDHRGPVDPELLFGVCYVDFLMRNTIEISQTASLMGALGVRSVRLWMHATNLTSDYKTIDRSAADRQHTLINAMRMQGVDQIIGMSHYWYLPDGTPVIAQVPYRDTSSGSDYMMFLEKYKETWRVIAEEFPQVTHWEMGNEMNHNPFLRPIGYRANDPDGIDPFTMQEKADITTDMMFYASQGIREGNPAAITMMPGMAPVDGMSGTSMTSYLEMIYKNIESGDFGSTKTDDFFETVAWHPYSWTATPDMTWVENNHRIHNIMKKYGDGDKKVYLTEIGFNDGGNEANDEAQKQWVINMFNLVAEHMPYVEAIHYYKMFDNEGHGQYGLIKPPAEGFYAKHKAFGFQQASGGTGNLNRYVIDRDNYKPGDNVAFQTPVEASTTLRPARWGWSLQGLTDGNYLHSGWTSYYEYGDASWITSPDGGGSNRNDDQQWVQVDLTRTFNIDRVDLHSRDLLGSAQTIQGLPRKMHVSVSTDGNSWTKVKDYEVDEADVRVYPSGQTRADTPMVLSIEFDEVEARYVKVTFTMLDRYPARNSQWYYVQIMEMEVIKSSVR